METTSVERGRNNDGTGQQFPSCDQVCGPAETADTQLAKRRQRVDAPTLLRWVDASSFMRVSVGISSRGNCDRHCQQAGWGRGSLTTVSSEDPPASHLANLPLSATNYRQYEGYFVCGSYARLRQITQAELFVLKTGILLFE